jgi:hypothetical protein
MAKTRKQQLIDAVWVNPASGPLRIIWKFGSVDDWKKWRQVNRNSRHVNDVLFLGDWIKWAINVLIPSSPTYHLTDRKNSPDCHSSCNPCVDLKFFMGQTKEATITFQKLRIDARRILLMRKVHLQSHERYVREAAAYNNKKPRRSFNP